MRVIGMISGTSFDAVEAVLADLELRDDVLACDLVEHRSVSYPPAVRDAISAMLPPAATTIEQVCQLDVAIGQFFGSVAKDILGTTWWSGRRVFAWADGFSLGGGRSGERDAATRRAGLDRRGNRRRSSKRRPQS